MKLHLPKPALIVIATLAGVLIFLGVVTYLARSSDDSEANVTESEAVADEEQAPIDSRCASQQTYDIIKRDLFRQAAQTRGTDRPAFDRLASFSIVRMEEPVVRSRDESLGIVRCSGRLSLDLPPGVAVVGGRRSLSADVEYAVQAAADGSGDVVVIEGADAIVVPLATLARLPSAEPEDQVAELPLANEAAPAAEAPAATTDALPDEPRADANPSFNCRFARTRGEVAVCGDLGLAALDRQMAIAYSRAWGSANAQQRALLLRTRDRFLSFRDACRSSSCVADSYRGRMREISDIMSGDWQPPR